MGEVSGFEVFDVKEASETERRRNLSGDSDAVTPKGRESLAQYPELVRHYRSPPARPRHGPPNR
jgi:hypothetical protein